jgi:hypothetical protein
MARPKKSNEVDGIITSIGSLVPDPSQVVVQPDNNEPARVVSVNSLAGKEISINLKATSYFGIGPIWLTPENYWCTVPDNLTYGEYDTIAKSIRNGTVVLGKVFIPPVEKASNILDKYWLMIERNGFDNKKTKTDFSMLIKRGSDSGWTALEIVNYCLEKENSGRRRKEVIRLLEQVIKNYDGPLRLYEPPDREEGIKKVTITPDGTMTATTNSGTEIAKPVAEPSPPKDFVRGNKSASQAVNEMFS